MTRKIVLIACMVAPMAFVSAQKYQFEYQEKEQQEIESTIFKKHYLGEEIAIKMQLMKEEYTYQIKDEIALTESTEIEKASIYKSVNKVSKYLKKGIKKGEISEAEAKETLAKILDVAINIRYQETAELEEELWSLKDPVAVASFFDTEVALH